MKFNVYKSIFLRSALITATVIFSLGTIAAVLIYFQAKEFFIDIERKELVEQIDTKADKLELIFSLATKASEQIAKADNIRSFIETPTTEEKDHVLQHLEIFNTQNSYDAIYLLDKTGVAIVSTDRSFENNDYSFRDYYKKTISGYKTIDSAVGSTSGIIGYYFANPIYSSKNETEIIGAVVVKINIKKIIDLAGLQNDQTKLIDENGVILNSNDNDIGLKSISSIPEQVQNSDSFKRKYAEAKIESLNEEKLWKEIQNYQNNFISEEKTNTNKVFYNSVAKIGESKYMLIYKFDVNQFIIDSQKSARSMAFVIVLTSIVALIIVNYYLWKATKPITELINAAKKLESGEKNYFAEKSSDEWQELRNSFESMQDQIFINKNKLEKVVIKKTEDLNKKIEELERFNKITVDRELKIANLKKELKEKK
ncbi:MAG: hypothetical protein AUK08_00690 [Candidatus Pacebacteria bacterium CG2_30_36_39]|nr:MAG: hypothetical protein AUK08_00690 [Candidatus Pacebacteria bacterium CG2_30_36_39]